MNATAQQSIEAEKGILGSILQDANVFEICAQQITVEHFHSPAHRTIYSVLAELRSDEKLPPNEKLLIPLTIALDDRKLLSSIGGAAYVTELFNFVPTAANIQYYIDKVREKHEARKLDGIASNIIRLGKNGSSPAEITALAEKELAGLHSDRDRRIQFYSPSELRDFHPENELVLVGDSHIMRGEVFVIAGEPGIGKSRALTHLAVCGATQKPWFGLTVRRKFKTLIVQTENGRYRLKQEFDALAKEDLDDWLLVSEPPPFGLSLSDPQFQGDIRSTIRSFKPELVGLDPWNAAAADDKQKDYLETFNALRAVLPTGEDRPALGIVAHLRKPQNPREKRIGGTWAMHEIAGSYVLSSVPRCIFAMFPGSNEETDDSIVLHNPKNNNGQKVARSAWERQPSGFIEITEKFDWTEFDKAPGERVTFTVDHFREAFHDGRPLTKNELKQRLMAASGITNQRSTYNAINAKNRPWSKCLHDAAGMVSFIENPLGNTDE